MEKNEVYDYLAKIYLDKQPAAKTDKKLPARGFNLWLLFLILISIGVFGIIFYFKSPKLFLKPKAYSLYVATGNELIKIKYNFASATTKKEGYTLTLSDLNAQGYSMLQFQARSLKKNESVKLKVELENSLKENSFVYIEGLTDSWKKFNIALPDFKEITHWDTLTRISFIVEEWNVVEKDDSVYIDDIRLTKER